MANGKAQRKIGGLSAGMRAMGSALVERLSLASMLGKTFEGARDVYTVLGYKRVLTFDDFAALYKRGGIAQRIIDAPVEATWSGPPRVVGTKKLMQAWELLEHQHGLLNKIIRADKLASLGQFGILLLGFPGDPSMPVSGDLSAGGFLYAAPYGQNVVSVKEFEESPTSSRFGKPKIYTIQRLTSTGSMRSALPDIQVHYTRVLHLAEGLLQDEIYGTPQLESVYNLFDDLQKIVGGSAEFFWRIADRGIHFDISPELDAADDELDELEEHITEYDHGLRRMLMTRGVTSKVLGSENADPRGPSSTVVSMISGTKEIPQRILTGSERGQLASSQDQTSWVSKIQKRRTSYADPRILRPFIEHLQELSVLPGGSFVIEWPVLQPQSEEERSVIAARISTSIKNVALATGTPPISPTEYRNRFLGVEGEAPEIETPSAQPTQPPAEEDKDADEKEDEQDGG